MENYYDKCKAKIKSIIEEEQAKKALESHKEYNQANNQIKAFYAYKSFIGDVLPLIFDRYIAYELKTDVLSSEDTFDIKREYMQFGLSIVAVPNDSFKYTYNKKDHKNYLIVEPEIFTIFLDYLKRMVSRNNLSMSEKYQSRTDYDLENYNKEYYENYYALDLNISSPIIDLIDCYYNELQALELI